MEELFLHCGEGAPTADYFQSLMELGERVFCRSRLCFVSGER